jgi:PhnB protein
MPVKPIPDGYHSVTPTLNVEGAARLIDYMRSALGAEETLRMPAPDGRIAHAEVRIGDSLVMVSDAMEQPRMPGSIFLYVKDVDAVYDRAVAAGGKSLLAPMNMFWGDRFCRVEDAFGNIWAIATHVEDVPPEEIPRRAAAAMQQQAKP